MSRGRRWLRIGLRVLAVPVVLLLVCAVGVLGHNEWRRLRAGGDAAATHAATVPGGDAAAPVIVLLHGAGLNGHAWDPVRRQLEPRWRVVAPDLPGHGADRARIYTLQSATQQVAGLARAVAPAPVILVGDSLGGYTAMAAARSVPPSQLRGVVVSGAGTGMRHRAALAYLRDAPLVRAMTATIDVRTRVDGLLKSMGYAEPDRRAVLDAGIELDAVPAAVRDLLYVDFRGRVAGLDVPLLIANGSLDVNAVAQEDELAAAAKHAQRHRFEGIEHGVSMRRSAEFARLVDEFASRVFAAGRPSP